MSAFATAAPDLIALGYSPVPLIPHDWMQHTGRGKCPGEYRSGGWQGMSKWQRFRDTTPSDFEMGLWSKAPGANIGLMMGTVARRDLHVVSLDFDAKDADALDTLLRAAPASPMVKRGQKGETRFYLAPKTLKTASYDGPDGRLLDRLTGFDCRQTVVPPSIHPDTMQPYVWLSGPVRAEDLPVLTEDDIEALEEALEQCGWSRERVTTQRDRPARPAPVDTDDLWSETKAAALANLDKWVPALDLYGCRPARGGYEAVATWRASSTGRPIAERKLNLSIQRDGIKDFGTNDTYSAIDLVMAAKDCDQAAATDWLRVQLGLKDEGVVIALGVAEPSRIQPVDHDLPEPLRQPKVALAPPQSEAAPAPAPAQSQQIAVSGDLPDALTRVPGLLGEITDWISDTARKPQRAGNLLAALEIIGTAAGRTFGGPTDTGTHLYGLFLAPSGAAKDHPLKSIDRVLRAATMGAHVGPGEFMSMSALVSRLNRQPNTVTCIDEFGGYLGRINGKKSSTHEKAITRTLRSAWGSSFETMLTPEWAGRVGEPIFSPALSIYGVSTHEEFFRNLEGDDVFNGFLNRFLIFSTQTRVEEREPLLNKADVPASIIDQLVAIYTAIPALSRATSHNQQSDKAPITVKWEGGVGGIANCAWKAFAQECERMERDAVFYTRSAEMAQRLAVIRAIGICPKTPIVTLEDMDWGIAVARYSASQTVAMASDYMAETQNQIESQRVLRIIREGKRMLYRDLLRAMQHRLRARDLQDILKALEEAGQIVVEEGERPATGGHKPKYYRVA